MDNIFSSGLVLEMLSVFGKAHIYRCIAWGAEDEGAMDFGNVKTPTIVGAFGKA